MSNTKARPEKQENKDYEIVLGPKETVTIVCKNLQIWIVEKDGNLAIYDESRPISKRIAILPKSSNVFEIIRI